jgi:hypothetical protein
MAHIVDGAKIRDELVTAVKQGDETRARALVPRLGTGTQQVRAVLEAMLEDPHALVRQAAAFGLGELGGAAIARRLEQQLAIEEARGNHDGESVIEEVTRALGRIEEDSARTSLVRRLERLISRKPERSDVNELALALWRRRHPELVSAVRQSLERLTVSKPNALHGLLLLLEKSPEELRPWAQDPAVPVEHKTGVITVLQEELPDALIPTMPAFISAIRPLIEQALSARGEAAYYCECLFSLLLLNRERVLEALSEEVRSSLRFAARSLVASVSLGCAIRAARVLKHVGCPEDAAILEAHRPADPSIAKVFDEAARALRTRH